MNVTVTLLARRTHGFWHEAVGVGTDPPVQVRAKTTIHTWCRGRSTEVAKEAYVDASSFPGHLLLPNHLQITWSADSGFLPSCTKRGLLDTLGYQPARAAPRRTQTESDRYDGVYGTLR